MIQCHCRHGRMSHSSRSRNAVVPSLKLRRYRSVFAIVLLLFVSNGFATDALETTGRLAEQEMRVLAERFPGRMAGSEQERAAARYLADRLADFGYRAQLQEFPVRYSFHPLGGQALNERDARSANVVAELSGRSDRLIIIGAHYDTAVARTEAQAEAGIGGPQLQGVDDNASGVGVILELAARLAGTAPEHTIRFIAFGSEEVGLLGARHAVAAMDESERDRVVLMVNIDSIITGDYLYVHAGPSTYAADPKAGAFREQAREIAAGRDIELRTNPGLNPDYPTGTGCCSDQIAFDEAGITVINFEATNWALGDKDGYQQTAINSAFPTGESWHSVERDSLTHLETHLPRGRLSERPAQVVSILLALLEQWSGLTAE